MRILITGASGNLASGIIDPLAAKHELVLSDIVPIETPHTFIQADVRHRDEFIAAAKHVDLIIHTPAWHGIQLKTHSEAEFWDLNVDGTFNMFQAALANGIKRVVWISSQSVFSNENIYGITKIVGEELCRYYERAHAISCIMLRPHDFTPYRSNKWYGERLLRGGVDRRDVLQATLLAAESELDGCIEFPVLRDDPFTEADAIDWAGDPAAVLERYFPGARDLVTRYNLDLPVELTRLDITTAKAQLGYQPQYNAITFLGELAEHDRAGDAETWLEQS